MSRVGKHPVEIPSGVDVVLAGRAVTVKGKLGELKATLPPDIEVTVDEGKVWVKPNDETKRSRAMWGTARSVVNNMVTGVSEGFKVELEINGVGYRAATDAKVLTLQLGFSSDVLYTIPQGIKITCERPTHIAVFGTDRQRVGRVAAEIRSYRKPEPYKGKGIRYVGERVRRKEGKKK